MSNQDNANYGWCWRVERRVETPTFLDIWALLTSSAAYSYCYGITDREAKPLGRILVSGHEDPEDFLDFGPRTSVDVIAADSQGNILEAVSQITSVDAMGIAIREAHKSVLNHSDGELEVEP